MKKVDKELRVKGLIEAAISKLSLDLTGITVLTEAASGYFYVTPIIAALAGADFVFAVTRDSDYGKANEVKEYVEEWADYFSVSNRIYISEKPAHSYADQAQLITNLNFVRPINESIINLLPNNSAISLMVEPWEFRQQDVDLAACRRRGIPVLGTWENHPDLLIFKYVGILALKLLLERDIELFKSKVLVIASGYFGDEIKSALLKNDALVKHLDPLGKNLDLTDKKHKGFICAADAIVVAEYNTDLMLLGGNTGIPLNWIVDKGIKIIHISGNIDYEGMDLLGITKTPQKKVKPGYMVVTTDYLGPRPVVDLHTAGLKVGEALVRGKRQYGDVYRAKEYALNNSPALDFGV